MVENRDTVKLYSFLKVINKINKIILRAKSEEELFQKICDVLYEAKRCEFIWIGLLEDKQIIIPSKLKGSNTEFIKAIRNLWRKYNFKKSPIAVALKDRGPLIIKNLKNNKGITPWEREALKKGYKSSIILSLVHKEDIIGTINIYSNIANYFSDVEVEILTDISFDIAIGIENLRAEDELKKSERKFSELVNQLPEMVIETDLKGNITFANYTAYESMGYSKKDFNKGLNVAQFVIQKDIKKIKENIKRIIEGRKVTLTKYMVVRKDGTKFPVIEHSKAITNDSGKIIGFRSIIVDITEREKLVQKLKESEIIYRTIFESSGTAMLIIEEDTTISLVNSEFERLSGCRRIEVEGKKSWTEFVVKEDLEKMEKYHYLRRIDSDVAPRNYEFRFINGQGNIKNIYATISMIPETKKSIAALLDVTGYKKAEEEVRESHAKLQKTLSKAIDTIGLIMELKDPYTSGHQKRVAKLATAIAKEMGLAKDEIEAINTSAKIHDLGKIKVPSEILNHPGSLSKVEFEIIKKHPKVGYEIIKNIDYPLPIAEIILQHHERLDGSGYPQGLKDGDILVGAKILAVADVVEAMSYHRSYRPALGIGEALEEIKKNRGILYDSDVVDACIKVFKEKRSSIFV